MYVNTREMLLDAQKRRYSVIAAGAWSLDSAKTLVQTAMQNRMPLILMTWEKLPQGMLEPELAAGLVKELASRTEIPIALHLDHSTSLDMVARCIHAGYSSVMIDASTLPFADNVKVTKEVVGLAHACNVSVEAELGHVGNDSVAGDQGVMTCPEEAAAFVEQTQVDCLAVSIGTVHGVYAGEPHLDFERLRAIRHATDTPLVLHGGSGTGILALQQAAACGICKLNVMTDFQLASNQAAASNEKFIEPRMQQAVAKLLQEYLQALSKPWPGR